MFLQDSCRIVPWLRGTFQQRWPANFVVELEMQRLNQLPASLVATQASLGSAVQVDL